MPRVFTERAAGLRLLRFVPFARPGAGELRQLAAGGRANFHELSNPAEAEVEILVRQQVAQRRQRLQPSRQAAKGFQRFQFAQDLAVGIRNRSRRGGQHDLADVDRGVDQRFHPAVQVAAEVAIGAIALQRAISKSGVVLQLELKYLKRSERPQRSESVDEAGVPGVTAAAGEATAQLEQYLADERLARQFPGVRFIGLVLVFRGWELVYCDAVRR